MWAFCRLVGATLGILRQSVHKLVSERRSVCPGIAWRLSRVFGATFQYWLNLQRNVDLWDAFENNEAVIEAAQPLEATDALG